MSKTLTITCTDTRCTDGITMCQPCNGHGLVSPRGGKYRTDRTAYRRNHEGESFPSFAVAHHECNGTGMVECGCRPIDLDMSVTLAGTLDAVQVQRWSTVQDKLVTVGVLTTEPKAAPKAAPKAKVTRERGPGGQFLPKGQTPAPAPVVDEVDHSMDHLDWDAIEGAQVDAKLTVPKLKGNDRKLLIDSRNGVVKAADMSKAQWARLVRLGLVAEHMRKGGNVPVLDLAKWVVMSINGNPPMIRPAHLTRRNVAA